MSDLPGLVELARLPVGVREDLLQQTAAPANPLRAVEALRRERPDLSPGLASAVVAQRGYRAKARSRGLLPEDDPLLTTDVGLEQATRPEVAAHRATTLARAGVRSVVDASAGIGMDSRAFLAAGLDVVAFERDPITAEVCRANLDHASHLLGRAARVECADSTTPGAIETAITSLPRPVAVFVDPARRSATRPVDGTRAKAERDRHSWSPPWTFVESLRMRFDAVAVKTPPGFTPDLDWKAEWIAVGDSVVECALYSPTASLDALRAVTIVLPDGQWSIDFPVDAQRPPSAAIGRFLAEVHPVARRTGAIARICSDAGNLAPVGASTMWLTSETVEPTSPALRWFEVLGSGSIEELKALCHHLGIERVALKTAESRSPQAQLRERIDLPDGDEFAIVVIADVHDHVLVRRIRPT